MIVKFLKYLVLSIIFSFGLVVIVIIIYPEQMAEVKDNLPKFYNMWKLDQLAQSHGYKDAQDEENKKYQDAVKQMNEKINSRIKKESEEYQKAEEARKIKVDEQLKKTALLNEALDKVSDGIMSRHKNADENAEFIARHATNADKNCAVDITHIQIASPGMQAKKLSNWEKQEIDGQLLLIAEINSKCNESQNQIHRKYIAKMKFDCRTAKEFESTKKLKECKNKYQFVSQFVSCSDQLGKELSVEWTLTNEPTMTQNSKSDSSKTNAIGKVTSGPCAGSEIRQSEFYDYSMGPGCESYGSITSELSGLPNSYFTECRSGLNSLPKLTYLLNPKNNQIILLTKSSNSEAIEEETFAGLKKISEHSNDQNLEMPINAGNDWFKSTTLEKLVSSVQSDKKNDTKQFPQVFVDDISPEIKDLKTSTRSVKIGKFELILENDIYNGKIPIEVWKNRELIKSESGSVVWRVLLHPNFFIVKINEFYYVGFAPKEFNNLMPGYTFVGFVNPDENMLQLVAENKKDQFANIYTYKKKYSSESKQFYEKIKSKYQGNTGIKDVDDFLAQPYEKFRDSKPILFWKDPLNRWQKYYVSTLDMLNM